MMKNKTSIFLSFFLFLLIASGCKKRNAHTVVIQKVEVVQLDSLRSTDSLLWDSGINGASNPDLAVVGDIGSKIYYDVVPGTPNLQIEINDTLIAPGIKQLDVDTFSFRAGLIDWEETKTDLFGHQYWIYEFVIPYHRIHPYTDLSPFSISDHNNTMLVYFTTK